MAFTYLVLALLFVVPVVVAWFTWRLTRQIQRAWLRSLIRAGVLAGALTPTILPVRSLHGALPMPAAWVLLSGIFGFGSEDPTIAFRYGGVPLMVVFSVIWFFSLVWNYVPPVQSSPRVTDIWFRSDLDVETLAAGLGLGETEFDAENYWEWAIGTFRNVRLDITRTHTEPAGQTDTRIFIASGAKEFDPSIVDEVVLQLHVLNISPVYLGAWTYERDNVYNKQIIEKRTKA